MIPALCQDGFPGLPPNLEGRPAESGEVGGQILIRAAQGVFLFVFVGRTIL